MRRMISKQARHSSQSCTFRQLRSIPSSMTRAGEQEAASSWNRSSIQEMESCVALSPSSSMRRMSSMQERDERVELEPVRRCFVGMKASSMIAEDRERATASVVQLILIVPAVGLSSTLMESFQSLGGTAGGLLRPLGLWRNWSFCKRVVLDERMRENVPETSRLLKNVKICKSFTGFRIKH